MVDSGERTILYIDPFSGVSGDMFLGALMALGVPEGVLAEAVESVIPGEVRIGGSRVTRSGMACTACRVQVVGGPGRRTLEQMLELVEASNLAGQVKEAVLGILNLLGEAERAAHGSADGPVHLHELGGQDTLADVVGTAAGVAYLAPDEIVCGPVNVGGGFVETDHGLMPVPAPATALLLEGMPILSRGPEAELTTPTGAALVRGLSGRFGPLPPMTLTALGGGAGGREHEGLPNMLRLFLGRGPGASGEGTAVMIECGVDDVSPEYLASAVPSLQEEGALEVHLLPAHTKKGRLGVLLRVLCPDEAAGRLMERVLDETGSAGLRYWQVGRRILPRETVTVQTPFGPVTVKRWRSPSGTWRYKPEHDQVRDLARKSGVEPSRVRDLAVAAYLSEEDDGQKEN